MASLFSNGPHKDFVIGAFQKCLSTSKTLFVAAPYVTLTSDIAIAASQGKTINLLVGLNVITSPNALRTIFGKPNVAIRYYTSRFHAKIYLFDDCALLGSSNLTDPGMKGNREATLLVRDTDQVQDIRALCQELWSGAPVLTPATLLSFETAIRSLPPLFDPDAKIANAVEKAEPASIVIGSNKKSSEYIFLQSLRARVYEQFKPSFDKVTAVLSEYGYHRPEWNAEDRGSETNRFLNWARLTKGAGDEWSRAPLRKPTELDSEIRSLGAEWVATHDPKIPSDYFDNMRHLRQVFLDKQTLLSASKEHLSQALMGIHAFEEQIRFISGGYAGIINFFWRENDQDVERIKRSLNHLLFDNEEFIRRLYDVLNFPEWKIRYFGESCALELSGTVKPDMCPPMNGRSAKALRCIGFDVPTS